MANHPPYQQTWEAILEEQGVALEQGLAEDEVQRRLEQHGPNQLQEHGTKSGWAIFVDQFKGVVVILLVAAAVVSFALQDWTEGFAVLAVIAINAGIGFFTEIKATRSMEALYKMGSMNTRVRRGGQVVEAPAADLVPGDIVILEGGDIITADLRIIEASKMECDESALTGESVPVSKSPDALEGEPPLAERSNMLYKGTALTRGSGAAVVVGTGMDTELGKISSLVAEAEDETTPLEENLDALGRKLVWVVLAITVVVWVMGVVRGKEMFLMLETAIALAVASIPEGLPIVATIALSRGMLRMAKRQALARRLASVETLGSTNIICTDKTGTLTENKMTVCRVDWAEGHVVRGEDGGWPGEGGGAFDWAGAPLAKEALEAGVLCNNAALQASGAVGDPLEVALLEAGLDAGIERDALVAGLPEVKEDAFDSDSKMMATYHEEAGGAYLVAIKGAPEPVLAACGQVVTAGGESAMTDAVRQEWVERNEQLGRDGYRVIAVARKRAQDLSEDPYEGCALVGLLGMVDPPRLDIRPTIEKCHSAGIRIVMVTGDQPPTALNVAEAVGLVPPDEDVVIRGKDIEAFGELDADEKRILRDASVFARVTPKQKLDLIALHQENNAIVAMTGDGVNDAPALKKADIGVAMGLRGTQVAQQAADVVLKDDSFKTIVYAIQEGRVIFGNIRKFVMFLLSCNIAEVLVIFLASLINTPLPILPLQILLLNLVTDVFPALALGAGEGGEGVMGRPPRPKAEPVLTRGLWQWLSVYGVILGFCTLGAFGLAYYVLKMGEEASVTVSFLTLAFCQLFHVFNMREPGTGLFNNEVTRNPFVWAAFALCTGILLVSVYVPSLADVLHTVPLGVTGWAIVVPMSIAPVGADVVLRKVRGEAA